jgi:xylose isomerase
MSHFSKVPKIQYEGRTSKNPFAFKHYNSSEIVFGKTMEEHLRFAVAYWHTFNASGADPFGAGTAVRSWDSLSPLDKSKARVEANFELLEKLNVPFYAFHDADIAPEGASLIETNKNLDVIVAML